MTSKEKENQTDFQSNTKPITTHFTHIIAVFQAHI